MNTALRRQKVELMTRFSNQLVARNHDRLRFHSDVFGPLGV
jgi:hypothetical protein